MTLTAQQILDEIKNRCLPHHDIRNGDDESEWAVVEVDGSMLDIEFWTEEQTNGDILYRITAYPMSIKDGVYVGDYSQWLTLHSEIV
jgi:hypothetical protein